MYYTVKLYYIFINLIYKIYIYIALYKYRLHITLDHIYIYIYIYIYNNIRLSIAWMIEKAWLIESIIYIYIYRLKKQNQLVLAYTPHTHPHIYRLDYRLHRPLNARSDPSEDSQVVQEGRSRRREPSPRQVQISGQG